MKIIIKRRSKDILLVSIEDQINQSFGKILEGYSEPIICEVTLEDVNGSKGGWDKKICANCSIGHVKKSVYIEVLAVDFISAINLAAQKLGRALHHTKKH